jgi:hypothetical protein
MSKVQMEACVVEHRGALYVFRRTNDLPTSGMFMDRCWHVAQNAESDALADARANVWINEKHLGVRYERHQPGVCVAFPKKNMTRKKEV